MIVNREELTFLLSETSGLEYMVMRAHLFAAFSLPRHAQPPAAILVR